MVRIRRFESILVLLAAVVGILSASAFGAEQPRYLGLTILHTSDVHGHLLPFDYDALGKQEESVGGAARRATLVRQFRASAEYPVMVVDAGDVFTRGPLADLKGVADFDVMNAIPYDVMTLGNNEFKGAPGDEGQRVLFDRIKQARFPIICANVFHQSTGKPIVPEYKIFEYGELKVGVFGLTAQRVASYEQARGLEVRDPVAAARRVVSELEGKCNLIVALTHVGYPVDLQIASAVPQIDVIMGGDTHTWLFEPTLVSAADGDRPSWSVGGVIVCHAGEWGKALGKLDLSLRLTENGRYRVMGYSSRLVEVDSSVEPAADIERIVWKYTKPYLREIGRLDKAVSKKGAPLWVAQRMLEAAGSQTAAEPAAGIENGLPAGAVTYMDVRKMFPFVNPVVTVRVTAAQIVEFVNQSGAALAGAEVRDGKLFFDSEPAAEDELYSLAVEDFYASAYPPLASAEPVPLESTTRDIVIRYLQSRPH